MVGKKVKVLAVSAAAIAAIGWYAPARADLIDPTDPGVSPFVIQQGDFSTVGLNYYGTLASVNTVVKFGDMSVFIYTGQNGQTNPATMEQPYPAALGGSSPNPGQSWGPNYYFQMGATFNGAGCTPNCTHYLDPGVDPAGGTTQTWDTTIAALNTALGGKSPVFYFWQNETGNNNADTLDGIDELIWGKLTLHNSADPTGATDRSFYLTNIENPTAANQGSGPDPSVATCNVDPNNPYGPPDNAGCTTTNQNGTAENTNADPRWTYSSGYFCANSTTGDIIRYGHCNPGDVNGVNIENNLGVNRAGFAGWSDELNAILANGGCDPGNPTACWNTLQGDFRLSMVDNGFEVLAIAPGASVPPPPIPEPSSLVVLGTALAGLGWSIRRRRSRPDSSTARR